jgi:hypothetical protein
MDGVDGVDGVDGGEIKSTKDAQSIPTWCLPCTRLTLEWLLRWRAVKRARETCRDAMSVQTDSMWENEWAFSPKLTDEMVSGARLAERMIL